MIENKIQFTSLKVIFLFKKHARAHPHIGLRARKQSLRNVMEKLTPFACLAVIWAAIDTSKLTFLTPTRSLP